MQTTAQVPQPVPIFYGEVAVDTPTTIDLDNSFDWVLTFVYVQPTSGAQCFLQLKDESGVFVLATATSGSGVPSTGQGLLVGEICVGPRESLQLELFGVGGYVTITGYALTPTTTLHV